MSHLSDDQLGELLTAYVDGEVDPREKAFVEHLLREDRRAASLLTELRGLSTAVAQLPRHAAPTMIVEDIRRLVERDELLGGPVMSPVASSHSAKSRRWTGALALAAMVGMASAAVLYFQSQQRLFENVNSPVALNTSPADKSAALDAALAPKRSEEVVRALEPTFPPNEETLTRFVDQVLALAGSKDEGIADVGSAVGNISKTDGNVLALGLKVSDSLAMKGTSGSVEAALRRVAESTGSTLDSALLVGSSNEERRAVPTNERGAREAPGPAVRTWTLRVPVSQLPKYAEAVVSAGDPRTKVTLATGSTNINGVTGTKEAIRRVDQAWQKERDKLTAALREKEVQDALAVAQSKASRDSVSRSGGPLAELLKIIGLPESISLIGPPAPPQPAGDESSSPTGEDPVAAVRVADTSSAPAAGGPVEFKEEESTDSDAKAKAEVVERPARKDEMAPGIVERQLKKLRELPPAPASVASMLTAPVATTMEKYVTLVITVAVQPDDKPNAPRTSPSPASARPNADSPPRHNR